MKKLLIALVLVGVAFGASAQKFRNHGGGFRNVGPRVIVAGSPFYSFYRPFGLAYPYGFGYGAGYGYGYGYGYPNRVRPSRLDLEIQDIKLQYADRIKSARSNSEAPKSERRQEIRSLKNQRDRAIVKAQKDYYYNRSQKRTE